MPPGSIALDCRLRSVLVAAVIAMMSAATSFGAWAQTAPDNDPETIAAAREMMAAAGATKQFDTVVPTLVEQMARMFIAQRPSQEKALREAFDAIAKRMSERKDELVDQIAELYAREFKREDLLELTRFFKSEIGRRFVEGQAKILPRSMALGQRWGARIGREVDLELRREMEKRGIPL
jgi:hypothetical protein